MLVGGDGGGGGDGGNIWRTAPLIKPKERRVLSFYAATAPARYGGGSRQPETATLCKLHVASAASYTSYRSDPWYVLSRGNLRPFRFIRAKLARPRRAETGKTDVTRSSARIARSGNETPRRPVARHLPLSLSISLAHAWSPAFPFLRRA